MARARKALACLAIVTGLAGWAFGVAGPAEGAPSGYASPTTTEHHLARAMGYQMGVRSFAELWHSASR